MHELNFDEFFNISQQTHDYVRFSGFYSGKGVGIGLQGCNVIWTCRQMPIF
jgi:hypothetical protein